MRQDHQDASHVTRLATKFIQPTPADLCFNGFRKNTLMTRGSAILDKPRISHEGV
jgi:hypothetical protein